MKHDGRQPWLAAFFPGLAAVGPCRPWPHSPWLPQNGPDASFMVQEIFRNQISAFFAWVVMVVAVAVVVAI